MSKSQKAKSPVKEKIPTAKAPAKPKEQTRVREIAEMVSELEAQLELLADHAERAFDKREIRYCGEVATKLRLLVLSSPQNKALLFKVADAFNVDMTIEVPPDVVPRANNPTGKMHFEKFFERIDYMRASDTGPVYVSHRELIKIWSEKRGGAHSDWEEAAWIEHMFKFHNMTFDGFSGAEIAMRGLAGRTLQIGREVLELVRQLMVPRATADAQDTQA